MTENINSDNSVCLKSNEINLINNEIREIADQIKQLKERHELLLLKRDTINDMLILENSLKWNADPNWEEGKSINTVNTIFLQIVNIIYFLLFLQKPFLGQKKLAIYY